MKSPIRFKQIILVAFLMAQPIISNSQISIAEWNFPNNPDDATVDLFDPINTAVTITSQGGTSVAGFAQAGNTTRSANATTWQNGSGLKWWEINISTTGFSNLTISSKQYSSSTGPRDFKIQYKIGAGIWSDLPGATNIIAAANWTSAAVTTLSIPFSCYNQPAVAFRWIMTSNTSVSGGTVASSGNSRIDDIVIAWNSDDYYRSIITGDWNNISTWESSPDNITWNPAVMPPSRFAKTITVRNPNIVTINSDVNFDQTTVDLGGELYWASFNATIYDGPGIDLIVNGTLNDVATNNITFISGAVWQLGANGTVIKSNNGSANNWRDNYQFGISNIPATAKWIIRKVNGNNPSVSSLLMYYPNLYIENNTGANWIATGPSSFQGASSNTYVKGVLDIGGTGSNTVEFENTNTFASATVVDGDVIVRPGNILRNYGTGFELFSNLIVNGDVTYDANGGRQLIFSGGAAQNISGTGNLNIFKMVMNKSSNDLTLLRNVKVDNNITFNNPGGRILSSTLNQFIVEDGATAIGTNNSSFVHGPVTKLGNQAFTFPVGKNNDYQALGMGAGSGGSVVFWTEDFGSGCNTDQLATSYTGINGNWNITNTGTNESSANTWYVSAAENGNGAGSCGSACGNNRTLHVSSTAFGDLGAAYFESDAFTCSFVGLCGITNKRAESPVIDCTGKASITLLYNYMEYGEGTNDNATLWYFDGSVWTQLSDPAKTLCCGNVVCNGSIQGLWTAYSIALPASADNNANVRIGFNWTNNGNGVGTDPSFAVDDIRLQSAASSESYTGEYFHTNPQVVYNNVVNPFIDHISQCEYWTLDQNSGSSARTVTLTWDANSCTVNSLSDLTVARFNGLAWDDRGNGGTTGTNASGTITSATAQSQYGPFTLASTTPLNPLPVEYLYFNAICVNNEVLLTWITASETNSSHFEILRSLDGINFEIIGTSKAAGNSTNSITYKFNDNIRNIKPVYYRLRQIDFNGDSHYSNIIVSENCDDSNIFLSDLFVNNTNHELQLNLNSNHSGKLDLMIYSNTGQCVLSRTLTYSKGYNEFKTPLTNIATGIYLIRATTDEIVINKKVLIQ